MTESMGRIDEPLPVDCVEAWQRYVERIDMPVSDRVRCALSDLLTRPGEAVQLPEDRAAQVGEAFAKLAATRNGLLRKLSEALSRGLAGPRTRATSAVVGVDVLCMEFAWMFCFGEDCRFDFEALRRGGGDEGIVCCLTGANATGKSSFLECLCLGLFGMGFPSRATPDKLHTVVNHRKPPDEVAFVRLRLRIWSTGGRGEEYVLHRIFDRGGCSGYVAQRQSNGVVCRLHEKAGAVEQWVRDHLGTVDTFLLCNMVTQQQDHDFVSQKRVKQTSDILERGVRLEATVALQELLREARNAHKRLREALEMELGRRSTTPDQLEAKSVEAVIDETEMRRQQLLTHGPHHDDGATGAQLASVAAKVQELEAQLRRAELTRGQLASLTVLYKRQADLRARIGTATAVAGDGAAESVGERGRSRDTEAQTQRERREQVMSQLQTHRGLLDRFDVRACGKCRSNLSREAPEVADSLQELEDLDAWLERWQRVSAAREAAQVRLELRALERDIQKREALDVEVDTLREALEINRRDMAELLNCDVEMKNQQLMSELETLNRQAGAAQARLHELQRKMQRQRELQRLAKRLADDTDARLEVLDAAVRLFGEYRAWVLREVVAPFTVRETNRYLAAMDTRVDMAVGANGECCWTVDFGVPIERASGFQRFIVGLAVRLAMSRGLDTAMHCKLLCIDEGFAACDADNLSRVPQLLELLRPQFSLVLIVTHMDTLHADMVVTLSAAPEGARRLWFPPN
jgi:DNA repair exonuclease SbcCD ATPase subunit